MARDPESFDRIAKTVFYPVYPVLAAGFLSRSGLSGGVCLDLGTGTGLLAAAVARQSGMLVIGLDCDPGMLAIARTNTVESGRVELVLGDVGSLPFRGESIDLVVSRGSIYFWDDRPAVFADIERVLAPGGTAFCGGGFGTAELRERIFAEMRRRNPRWDEDVRRRSGRADPETLRRELRQSGVAAGDLVEDESGTWVRIRKA